MHTENKANIEYAKALTKALNLHNRKRVAEHLGIKAQHLYNICSGRSYPSHTLHIMIEKEFNLGLPYLSSKERKKLDK